MRLQRKRNLKKARIEIIPMIDTIFFLLVFFMISTLSMSRFTGVQVNLPKAASGSQPPTETAVISLTKEDQLFFNKNAISAESLQPIVERGVGEESRIAGGDQCRRRRPTWQGRGNHGPGPPDRRHQVVHCRQTQGDQVMKDSLFSGFALSALIHAALIPTASLLIAGTRPTTPTQNIEVSLTDVPKVEQTPEPAPEPKPEPKKIEKIKAPKLIQKTDIARVEPNEPPPKVEELPPPPRLTASGPEKGSVASKAPAGEAAGGEAGVGRSVCRWRRRSHGRQRYGRRRRWHGSRRIRQRRKRGRFRRRWQWRWACRDGSSARRLSGQAALSRIGAKNRRPRRYSIESQSAGKRARG